MAVSGLLPLDDLSTVSWSAIDITGAKLLGW